MTVVAHSRVLLLVFAIQLIKTANSHHASLLHGVNYWVMKLIVNTRTSLFREEFLIPEEESRFMFLLDTILIAISDVRLIVLSILIAVIGSCTALDISEQIYARARGGTSVVVGRQWTDIRT